MMEQEWLKKAEEAFLQKNWDGLVHFSSKLTELDTNNPIGHCLLALGLDELRRYDDSANQMSQIEDYNSILEIGTYAMDLQARHPNNAPAQFLLGLSKNRKAYEGSLQLRLNTTDRDNLFKEAEEAFRKSMQLDPNFLAPKVGLAGMLGALRSKHDEAIALYKECISIDPQLGEAYRGMADELLTTGKDAEAKNAYEKCLLLPSAQGNKEIAKRQLALLAQKDKSNSDRNTKDWPIFEDKNYGLFFQYPKGWDFYDEKNPGPLSGFFVEESGDKGLVMCLNPRNRDHNFNIRVVRNTPPSLESVVNELDQALAGMASNYKKISSEKITLDKTQAIVFIWQSKRMDTILLHKQILFTHKGNTFTVSCLGPQDEFKQIDTEFLRPFIESIKLNGNQ